MRKSPVFALLGLTLMTLMPAHAAALRCVMPNGVVVTRNMGACPADAAAWPDGAPKPPTPRAAAAAPPAGHAQAQDAVGSNGRLPVSADRWQGQWPLAQRSGWLSCQPVPGAKQHHMALFHGADGLTYALNGIAAGRAPQHGWHPIKAIWLPNPDIAGARIPLGDLISRATALCGA